MKQWRNRNQSGFSYVLMDLLPSRCVSRSKTAGGEFLLGIVSIYMGRNIRYIATIVKHINQCIFYLHGHIWNVKCCNGIADITDCQ